MAYFGICLVGSVTSSLLDRPVCSRHLYPILDPLEKALEDALDLPPIAGYGRRPKHATSNAVLPRHLGNGHGEAAPSSIHNAADHPALVLQGLRMRDPHLDDQGAYVHRMCHPTPARNLHLTTDPHSGAPAAGSK